MSKYTISGFIHRILPLVLLAGLPVAGGCNAEGNNPSQKARFETELKDADRLFAREVAEAAPADRDRVWASWFEPAGRQILPSRVVEGSSAIADLMAGMFSTPGNTLTWDPDVASASDDGTMGWTSGRYESRSAGPEGEAVQHGRYLSIWKRQADGNWKVALDTGVPDNGP